MCEHALPSFRPTVLSSIRRRDLQVQPLHEHLHVPSAPGGDANPRAPPQARHRRISIFPRASTARARANHPRARHHRRRHRPDRNRRAPIRSIRRASPRRSPSRVLTGANRSIDANGFSRSIARDRGSRSLSRVAVTTPTASDRALTRIRASAPSRVSNESFMVYLWSSLSVVRYVHAGFINPCTLPRVYTGR